MTDGIGPVERDVMLGTLRAVVHSVSEAGEFIAANGRGMMTRMAEESRVGEWRADEHCEAIMAQRRARKGGGGTCL